MAIELSQQEEKGREQGKEGNKDFLWATERDSCRIHSPPCKHLLKREAISKAVGVKTLKNAQSFPARFMNRFGRLTAVHYM